LASGTLRPMTRDFSQLNSCSNGPYVRSSLTRGWVSNLRLLLVLTSAVILRSESRGTRRPHFTVSDSRLPQPGGPGSRIYIPQEQGGPVMSPGTGFPFRRLLRLAGLRWPGYTLQALGSFFVASYDSQGYGGGIRPRLHTGGESN
jgi:hypothetical protein